MTEKKTIPRSDAKTHINVLGQELVGRLVLVEHVGIDTGAGQSAAEEEAKQSKRAQHDQSAQEPHPFSPSTAENIPSAESTDGPPRRQRDSRVHSASRGLEAARAAQNGREGPGSGRHYSRVHGVRVWWEARGGGLLDVAQSDANGSSECDDGTTQLADYSVLDGASVEHNGCNI